MNNGYCGLITASRRSAGAVLAVLLAGNACAQQMDARLYANPPVGINFLIVGTGYLWGGIGLDPTLPIKDVSAKVPTASLSYARSVEVLGQSGTVAVNLPYAWVSATGEVGDVQRSVDRSGFADLTVRLAANLYGAPALSVEQFAGYQQDTIVGVSVLVTAPTGQYYSDKLINIGTNRWSFKPEIGVSKALGQLILEGAVGVTFFTANDAFLGSNVRKQDPLYAIQAHAIYSVNPALWGSLDTTYYWGGATSLNADESIGRQQNWRFGFTVSQALGKRSSLKLYAGTGVAARAGTNFNAVGLAFEYHWGGGL